MKHILFLFIALIVFVSCSNPTTFPERKSEGIGQKLEVATVSTTGLSLKGLLSFMDKYKTRDETFNLQAFENDWDILLSQKAVEIKTDNDIKIWMAASALLLELTQNEKYAAEMEALSGLSLKSAELLTPYIFTKHMDHIYVNLFQNREIAYSHSMGGEVGIQLETDYPKSGSVKLHFSMTERRHIELYIRIPDWAEGSSVTVKQVKYFAGPGSYCKIAKKWKEGDLVEIEFPIIMKPL